MICAPVAGSLLAGRYLLADEIGNGAMGVVYRATDLRTGGTVALKLLHPVLERDPTFRERLRREAQIAASLTSPRVVRVTDLDEHAGALFLVMEYVAGNTLQELLAQHGRFPAADALTVGLEVARALEAAHARGIVHRDLKPQNIKLTEGHLKVLDFGIARADGVTGLSQVSGVFGTPEYCAPEHAAGQADIRTDIYALGVTLYALIEGHVPFSGPTPLAVLRQHETAEAVLSEWVPEVVRAVIARCLAKDPAARYQTPRQLVKALQAALSELPPPSSTLLQPAQVATQAASSPTLELGSATSTPRTNLPAALTSFVGRERARVEVMRLLNTSRLLTLTGAGGAGKTRLALEVASDLVPAYSGGVWLVELAALTDARLVIGAIANALGVAEDKLIDELHPRRLLLVLDNCEHVIQACAQATDQLLRACPDLRILCTSREPLAKSGETTWRVPSLETPDAVRMFVQRAHAAQPDFELTERDAPTVAQICQRLDGIPLAIELAAARVSLLSIDDIHARLDDRFQLLAAGSRTALPRHRTLRATLDWSYDLLNPAEQRLFERLSVFAGSFTLESALAVAEADLDTLGHLVDKSLVVAQSSRYRLLETMREYAAERLSNTCDHLRIRSAHRGWYLALAQQAEPELQGQRQELWLERLDHEHDNFRAALAESAAVDDDGGLQLASALLRFWEVRGHLAEGRGWLKRLLARSGGSPKARARALGAAGVLASRQGDFAGAAALYSQALSVFGELDDQLGIARSLQGLGVQVQAQGDSARATALYEQSQVIYRALGDRRGIGQALNNLAYLALGLGQAERATELLSECIEVWREVGDRRFEALAMYNLADAARLLGDRARSEALFERSGELFRLVGDRRMLAFALDQLANLAALAHESLALHLHREALAILQDIGDRSGVAVCLEGLAGLFAQVAQGQRAVRLLGYAEALREAINAPNPPARKDAYARLVAAARASLESASRFEAEWTIGRGLRSEDAISLALDARLDAATA
jgi:non-specific serine/threonine protein kinase